MPSYHHIVCCLDFSDHAEAVFQAAWAQARDDGARLTLVHVLAPGRPLKPGGDPRESRGLSIQEITKRLHDQFQSRYLERLQGVEASLELRRGHPSIEILAFLFQSGADLVVVGSAGLSGVELVLLGSVAERLSRKAPCSCLVVRPSQAG